MPSCWLPEKGGGPTWVVLIGLWRWPSAERRPCESVARNGSRPHRSHRSLGGDSNSDHRILQPACWSSCGVSGSTRIPGHHVTTRDEQRDEVLLDLDAESPPPPRGALACPRTDSGERVVGAAAAGADGPFGAAGWPPAAPSGSATAIHRRSLARPGQELGHAWTPRPPCDVRPAGASGSGQSEERPQPKTVTRTVSTRATPSTQRPVCFESPLPAHPFRAFLPARANKCSAGWVPGEFDRRGRMVHPGASAPRRRQSTSKPLARNQSSFQIFDR